MSSRVPVGRRDDSAAGRDCECQRAGGDLLLAAIRRDEDVGCREQVGQLVDREEPVVELDVLGEIELEHAPLEHQAVASPSRRSTSGCVRPAIT